MADNQTLDKNAVPSPESFKMDEINKHIDDLLWYQRLSPKAMVDISKITGPAPDNTQAQAPLDKGNPVQFSVYSFVPRNLDLSKKHPALILIHGGIHGNFSSYQFAHIVEEMVDRGYIVIAPDYRGSIGYGALHYKLIDYGGLEVEDIMASREWALASYPFIDEKNFGIMGWSHGGMITLLSIFRHPGIFKAAFAGVPVSDLVARLGYHTERYNNFLAADFHIGYLPAEGVKEYQRRSPVWNVETFDNSPLLIHTNTSDEDVNVMEVQSLIRALKAEGKQFEYEIFENIEGGHMFDRIDTVKGRQIRSKIWEFMDKHLK